MPARPKRRKIKRRKGAGKNGLHKFNPRTKKLIYKCYEAGIPSAKRIAEIVGIDNSILSTWLDWGKDPAYPAHYAFRQKIMRIQSRREAEMLDMIEKCARGGFRIKETSVKISHKGREVKKRVRESAPQWQAAAWRLERWLPDDYGLKPANMNNDANAEDLAMEIQKAAAALDASVPDMFEDDTEEE